MATGNKSILLVISGGVAAYKSLELIRLLREKNYHVRVVMTRNADRFVTPLSVAALSGEKVYQDLFSLTDETEMGHIRLSREADLILLAPAGANLLARAAQGLCDDLAGAVLLAADKPLMIAPAMNVRMWTHPATQANLELLRRRGAVQVGPDEGPMACGEYGPGRMAEPSAILDAVDRHFAALDQPDGGRPMTALVTAGATREPLDPVRYLSNNSSGRQGYAVAAALAARGVKTILVSGPTALPPPPGVELRRVETAQEMLAACREHMPVDALICVAAVADWRPERMAESKLRKDGAQPQPIRLVENPDILATLAQDRAARPRLVVGFAAETEDLLPRASAKRTRKSCDWIVANDVSAPGVGFDAPDNAVHLITAAGSEAWPRMPKQDVAARLADRIVAELRARSAPTTAQTERPS